MTMENDLKEFRSITMIVDESNNIVIFPVSKSNELFEDGENYAYHEAYHPIELLAPYNKEELAEKISEGINTWNLYPAYENYTGKNTFEEKYFGIKGFKNAVLGKRLIALGWDDISGKEVNISCPLKRGYGYYCIKIVKLNDDADYLDFADTVIDLISIDLTKESTFKRYKKLLLLE